MWHRRRRRRARGATALAIFCLALGTCFLEPEPFETGAGLVLLGGTLIDGTGRRPVPDAALVIQGSVVAFAGPRSRILISPGADTVSVRGATILPGFINAHVHNAYSAVNLETWAQAGVTTVRDEAILASGASLADLIARRDTAWSDPRYARLLSAGRMITAPGGYGAVGVATAEAARLFVNDELDDGADLIKVAVEDGIAGRTDQPVLSSEALRAAVTAAHARGRRVSGHVTDAHFLQWIVDAGVDDAAHATWDSVTDGLFRRMISGGIALVPTLTVFEPFGVLAGAQTNLRRFVQLGGTVALGDDYGSRPASRNPQFVLGMPMPEIRWMAEAGLTPMQIIVAATRNAARVLNLESELGTLEPGKTADVLVVNGDPLEDLNALQSVRLVIHRGVVIRS